MKKSVVKITVLDVGSGFKVDIITNGKIKDAWLYNENYGIKDYMFGLEDISLDEFIEIVIANLINENYIQDYQDNYMDGDRDIYPF